MSIEDEVKALATNAAQMGKAGRLGQSMKEAKVHYELEAIWDALLLIARKLDAA